MTASNLRILIVDDEQPIRNLLRIGLANQGYAVSEASSARAAVEFVEGQRPDLILLDLNLPGMDGQELLRRWRDDGFDIPVVILSSRADEAGIVTALDLGADDYVTKPFSIKKLVTRIHVALRHRLRRQDDTSIFHTGDLSVDLGRRIVKVEGRQIRLSPKEYEILCILVHHAGKVLPRRFLLNQIRNEPTEDLQYLRVHVRHLRQKIEKSPDQPRYITTEAGIGYRLRR